MRKNAITDNTWGSDVLSKSFTARLRKYLENVNSAFRIIVCGETAKRYYNYAKRKISEEGNSIFNNITEYFVPHPSHDHWEDEDARNNPKLKMLRKEFLFNRNIIGLYSLFHSYKKTKASKAKCVFKVKIKLT